MRLHASRAARPPRETKAAAQRAQRFNAAILAHLSEIGAQEIEGHWRPAMRLETLLGPLIVTPLDTWLACRFDGDRAIRDAARYFGRHPPLGVNPHTGKFNCHPEGDVDAMVAEAIAHIARVPRLGAE